MIIHKLLLRYFTKGDDAYFYLLQASDSIKWLERHSIRLGQGVDALDLGCGHGVFGGELQKKGCNVTFADQDNYLVPELKSSKFKQINLNDDDYGNFGKYDLVICSNVFEHLARPDRFISECSKLLKPTGVLYLTWTNWLSPFGGHDFAPFHYLGPKFGRWIHYKIKGKWSQHIPYNGLYPTYIGRTLRMIRSRPELRINARATRYYPEFSFILNLPGLREVLAWNCALLIEKR